jgi:DNA-binding MarR family transcriptional regulator
MKSAGHLGQPKAMHDLLLYRLASLSRVGGAPMVRVCEGQYNITRREWRVLGAVVENPGISPSEVADRVFLDRARASKAVGCLVDKGLLLRKPKPGDARHATLIPTEKGQQLYQELLPVVAQHNQALLAVLSQAEVSSLEMMLSKLQNQAQQLQSSIQHLPKTQRGARQAG